MFDMSKMGDLIKNAQQMQQKIWQELGSKTVESSAGGGMVRIVMNGNFQVVQVVLEPDLLAMNDAVFSQDLIRSAVNDAIEQVKRLYAEQAKSFLPTP